VDVIGRPRPTSDNLDPIAHVATVALARSANAAAIWLRPAF